MQHKWQKIKGKKGIESTTFAYKCDGWKRERKFVAIRKELDPTTNVQTLFPIPKYEFFAMLQI